MIGNRRSCYCTSARLGAVRTFTTAAIAAVASLAFAATTNAQTFLMNNNNPETTCTGTFADSGDVGGDYAINEDFTKTFFPANAGDKLVFNFTAFGTESCCDDLEIYNGNSIAAPLIGTFAGTTSPGTVMSTALDGSLTFVWHSDVSIVGIGFEATISCFTPPAGGACCLNDGTCSAATDLADCETTQGGLYSGDGTDCAFVTCPPTGACCDGGLSCSIMLEQLCLNSGGIYIGNGSACTPDPCDCNNNSVFDGTDLQPSGAAGSDMGENFPGLPIDSLLPDAVDVITLGSADYVSDVNMELDVTHTFLADLEVDLEHLGVTVRVMDDNCGAFDNMMIVFDDEAATSIQGLTCINGQTGTFQPKNPLSAFDGLAAGGNWTLTINDDAGGDVGTLDRWKLIVSTLDTAPFSQDNNGNGVPDECDPAGACCLPTGMCAGVNDQNECEVTLGGIYQGDGTLCQFVTCPQPCTTCNSPVASFPYSEDFEVGLGLWTQSANDDLDWTRDSGGTPSGSTGPSIDHTLGTAAGFYMYTETSSGVLGSRYILDGPCFDLAPLTNPAFSFWYHMFGATMGTLSVEVSSDNCLSYTEVFSLSGNQGDVWTFQQIDLSAYAGQLVNIRFVGTRGSSFTGDMAIDDIGVGEFISIVGGCCGLDGVCTEVDELTCLGAGGIYRGNLTTCAGVDCNGACCMTGGVCANASEASCTVNGGSFAGEGTVCFTFDIPTGASNGGIICEGSCADLTILRNSPSHPSNIDIMFNNDVATADGVVGSCTGGGTAVQNDAYFRYLAISATNGPCDVTITATPNGYDGVLVVRDACDGTELACSDVGGTGGVESVIIPNYGPAPLFIQVGDFGTTEGGGLTQLEVTCSTLTGACCIGGTCDILTAGNCSLAGGIYKGDNTDCLASCFGACCAENGTCSSVTQVSCSADGGTYQGDGTSCDPNPCPQPPANDGCAGAIEVFDGANNGGNNCLASSTDEAEASCQANSGKDVWFFWTASCTGEATIDTEGSVFATGNDTVLSVYDACGGTELACDDDDGTGLLSTLTLNVTQGVDYYIRVAGFSTNCGDITLNISCTALCGTCPGDMNGDSLLDGLDIQTFANCYLAEFGTNPSAACKCADVNEDNTLDPSDITLFVDLILNGGGICNPGACCYLDGGSAVCAVTDAAGCANLGGDFTLGADCSGDPCPAGRCCSNGGLTCNDVPELECGAIGGAWDSGLDCTNDPCAIVPPNDTCATATVVDCMTGIIAGLTLDGANKDVTLVSAGSCTGFDADGPEIVYSFTPTSDVLVNAGMSNVSGFDATFYVVTDCADTNATCVAGDDSGGIEEVTFSATAGTTYFMVTDSWTDDPALGTSFDFFISCTNAGFGSCCLANGACVDVTSGDTECMGLGGTYNGDGSSCATTICGGACCMADGSCVDAMTGTDCTNLGGTYEGNGTECASTQCPQPLPANDLCADAEAMAIGGTVTGYTISATPETLGTCGTTDGTGGAVWYSVIGDGTTLTATTCNPGTDFDTKLRVYTDGCTTLTCVGGNDDQAGVFDPACESTGTGVNRASTISWCSTNGVEYLILVHGFSAAEGNFEMTVSSNFTPCP